MIDELINNVKGQTKFDKDAYIQKKKTQLDKAYSMIDNSIEELKTNKVFFKEYLDIQGNFDMYTPRNALLVAKQLPTATQLKEWNKWKEQKVSFKQKYPDKILILDPREPYTNKDGKKIISFTAKEVIDISQTNLKQNTKVYDKKLILQALLIACTVDIKAVDSLENDKVCEWNQEENAILVSRGKNEDEIIGALSKEIAEITLYEENKSIDIDKAGCIAYMVCKKYGIEIEVSGIDDLMSRFNKMDSKEIVEELSAMKDATFEINSQITQYLDSKKKDIREHEQER